jgi:two-component system, LytTR family, response regulator
MDVKTIIIDDESNNIQNLINFLEKYCNNIQIVATGKNADEGIIAIQKYNPDLVFLDIQMPNKSGFDMLNELPEITFEIIFITAFDQYGIQAIKFSALDYLLKPVDIEELKIAVQKAINKISLKQRNLNIDNLLEYIKKGQKSVPRIALPTLHETVYIKIDEIVRCEASDNYTTFYLNNSEKILVCKTLKEFSGLLTPYNFIRSHQSHLVNIQYIKSLLKEDGGVLLLFDKTKIPISRQNRELVKKALNEI